MRKNFANARGGLLRGSREVAEECFEACGRSRRTASRRAGGRGGVHRGAREVAEECFEARGRSRRSASRRAGAKWTRWVLTLTGLGAQSQHPVRVSGPVVRVSGPGVLIAVLRGCAIRRPDSGGPSGTQHSALSDSECQPSRCRDSLGSHRAGWLSQSLLGESWCSLPAAPAPPDSARANAWTPLSRTARASGLLPFGVLVSTLLV